MARERTTTVYTYDELTEEAKATARDWYRNTCVGDSWWTDTYEDIAAVAETVGISVEKRTVRLMGGGTRQKPDFSFDLDRGRYFGFAGHYDYQKGWKEKVKAEYGKDVFKRKEPSERFIQFYQHWAYLEHKIQCRAFFGLHGAINTSRNGTLNIEARCRTTTGYDNYANETQEDNLYNLIEVFTDFALDLLDSEYNYMTSDEVVAETIIANEYEFTEEGERV